MMVYMLDELYAARPEEFIALRTTLAAEAKKRGDPEAAAQLRAARKPTTAAWVVNTLAHSDETAGDRLRDLSAQLRDAHAEMDGARIRALTAEQRQLVGALTTEAFTAAGVASPSAALRDDVTATLLAAVADPEVAARLGRLVTAEQWSGFGVGASVSKKTAVKSTTASTAPKKAPKKASEKPAHQQRRRAVEAARAEMSKARQAKKNTDEALRSHHTALASARTRHQEAQRTLRAAEKELQDAEQAYADAEQAGLDAAARIAELRDRLDELRG